VQVEEQHDVVIIGAGVAGLSCALECSDIQLDTVVLEESETVGGQVAEIPHTVRNVATARYTNGRALEEALVATAASLGDRLRTVCSVTAVNLGRLRVDAGEGRFVGGAIVVATGTAKQELAAAPDGAFGGDVTYLVEADPEHFVGRDVAVVGGGDSATLDALALARSGSTVKLLYRRPALTARQDIVEQVQAEPAIEEWPGWELESIHGTDHLESIVARRQDGERQTIPVGGLVVKIARVPRTSVFADQLELDARGAIIVDSDRRTSCTGVFAAGDVVSGSYWRVASAMGEGSRTAWSVLRHLEGRL
jgi:thioredoxin reductase (NADPH)